MRLNFIKIDLSLMEEYVYMFVCAQYALKLHNDNNKTKK
jgi:hypothetical protein